MVVGPLLNELLPLRPLVLRLLLPCVREPERRLPSSLSLSLLLLEPDDDEEDEEYLRFLLEAERLLLERFLWRSLSSSSGSAGRR